MTGERTGTESVVVKLKIKEEKHSMWVFMVQTLQFGECCCVESDTKQEYIHARIEIG